MLHIDHAPALFPIQTILSTNNLRGGGARNILPGDLERGAKNFSGEISSGDFGET